MNGPSANRRPSDVLDNNSGRSISSSTGGYSFSGAPSTGSLTTTATTMPYPLGALAPPPATTTPAAIINTQQRLLQLQQQQQQQQLIRQQTIQQRQKEMQLEREKISAKPAVATGNAVGDVVITVSGEIPPVTTTAATNTTTSTSHYKAAASAAIAASASKTAPPLDMAQAAALLQECDWVDQSLWASRQFLGGNAVNAFLRSTSNMQKIRRAKVRQISRTKEKTKPDDIPTSELLNARTAKRMKAEMDQGMQFCAVLHDTIRIMLQEMDPTMPTVDPIRRTAKLVAPPLPPPPPKSLPTDAATIPMQAKSLPTSGKTGSSVGRSMSSRPLPLHRPSIKATSSSSSTTTNKETATAPTESSIINNSADGSTLRRYRKKKLPPSGEPTVDLPEFDQISKKRLCSKKEHTTRMAKVLRFRPLRQGDPVAARTSSRDVWILAQVKQDYQGPSNMAPFEFLRLTDSRRDQIYREKVVIQDVEDDGKTSIRVARNLCLPLPRNPYEAAEWCSRYFKKGSRVYAMYPQTTALYTATVVDSTTYCRGDDDIVVVEFDGDEPDETGKIPTCHIPARFVALVPSEFPGTVKAQRANPSDDVAAAAALAVAGGGGLDDLPFGDDGALPGIDDLDFDLFGD